MTHEHREVVERRPAAEVEQVSATAHDPYAGRRQGARKLVQAIYLLFGVILALIAIRFVLRLLGANPDAGFAQFIYGITGIFVAPFVGLFGTPQFGGSVLEPHSLVAFVIYALLAWVIAKAVWLLAGETRSAVTTETTSVDSRTR